ncbi:vitamin B12 transport system substrate-binding protein [Ferrimonas sediminum]|uniref:Vitamin B12 transport system substrate-binding protein n=1 Tax=Ferrimonas sediminum TaxID=718193 RepID=A0A1G8R0U8_9GAMM|nr:cobalamin-binding protein [Ferrimonas sediminum]SDJ10568.1 vitamin B12 transport system substrate-binding protein [Ferrimonas sediminum]
MLTRFLVIWLLVGLSGAVWAQKPPFPRIAALTPHSVELLYQVGAGDQIIATIDYADYPQAARQIRRIGRHDELDFEALVQLQPDLVVLGISDTSRHFVERLNALGLTVVDTSVASIADIGPLMASLGQQTGHPQQGQRAAAAFTEQYQRLLDRYQHRAPVTVFYQLWSTPLMTASSAWMDELIGSCGGVNLFADASAEYPQVSIEQVISASPQVLIVPTNHGLGGNSIAMWQQWSEIPAIDKGLVFEVNSDWLHRTGPRILLGMEQLCQSLDQAREVLRSKKEAPM